MRSVVPILISANAWLGRKSAQNLPPMASGKITTLRMSVSRTGPWQVNALKSVVVASDTRTLSFIRA